MKKIFIGLEDIASQIGDFAYGFRKHGIETLTAVYSSKTPRQLTTVDYHIEASVPPSEWFEDKALAKQVQELTRSNLQQFIWEKALEECDTFLFLWYSFTLDFSDFAELKRRGKTIITFFVGSDVRWYFAELQDFKPFGLSPMEYDAYGKSKPHLHTVLHYLRTSEVFADYIFSTPGQSEMALRPYFNVGVPIQMNRFTEHISQRKVPVVIHAPSRRIRKGTNTILATFQKLKDEGIPFEIELIEEMKHEDAIKRYENADILVGQLLGPYCGKQEREALACGTVVVSSMCYEYIKSKCTEETKGVSECPIIDANPSTLYTVLKETILNHQKRIDVAKRGRAWAEKYHSAENVAKKILDIVSKKSKAYEFYPTFFSDSFVPKAEHSQLFNHYTKHVSECEWYTTKPKERDGLIFPEPIPQERLKDPSVTVIVFIPEGSRQIQRALESIRLQEKAPGQVILVGKSIPQTPYESYVTEETSVPVWASDVIKIVRHPFILWMSADGILHPNYLQTFQNVYNIAPFSDVFYPIKREIDGSGKVIGRYKTAEYFFEPERAVRSFFTGDHVELEGSVTRSDIQLFKSEFKYCYFKELMYRTFIENNYVKLMNKSLYSYPKKRVTVEENKEYSKLLEQIVQTIPAQTLFPQYDWENPEHANTHVNQHLSEIFQHLGDYEKARQYSNQ